MPLFSIPARIQIEFKISFDPPLTRLLQQIADQGDDRAEAAKLSLVVRSTTAALAAVLPPR